MHLFFVQRAWGYISWQRGAWIITGLGGQALISELKTEAPTEATAPPAK